MHTGSGMRNSDGRGQVDVCVRAEPNEVPPAAAPCLPCLLSNPNLQGEVCVLFPVARRPPPIYHPHSCLQCYVRYGQMILSIGNRCRPWYRLLAASTVQCASAESPAPVPDGCKGQLLLTDDALAIRRSVLLRC